MKCPDCLEILDKCQCWMGGESEQEEKQREVGGQVQDEMVLTQAEVQQEETTGGKTGKNNDGKESSEHMGEEEAEETEGGANTSEVEVGHRRTEQMEVESGKRDSDS